MSARVLLNLFFFSTLRCSLYTIRNMANNEISLFMKIGLTEQRAKETAKNEALSQTLKEVILQVWHINSVQGLFAPRYFRSSERKFPLRTLAPGNESSRERTFVPEKVRAWVKCELRVA